jgi:hypothetical protein
MAKTTTYRQVKLRSGNAELVTNVRDHTLIKVGNHLTLDDFPDRKWDIVWVSDHAREKRELRTDWHNNI